VPLELDEVICSIDPSPTDPLRGEGPIGALASDLTQSDAQAEWQASFYRNSANPGGIIKVGRKLNDREWEELVERWRFEHQGSSNAGRVAVLEEGDFTPLSYAQKDMQFVESRGLTRQAIFDAYGFPKFGIGDVDDVNRASADASLALIAQTLAVPRLNDIRDVLNNRFLPMFGPMWRNYTFEYDSPVPPDAESERLDLTARANAFATLINVRVEPDDAAEVCGLPPMRVKEPEPVPAPAPGRGVPGAPAGDPDEDPQKDPEQEKE
jgi:HK97 family phage portal protein